MKKWSINTEVGRVLSHKLMLMLKNDQSERTKQESREREKERVHGCKGMDRKWERIRTTIGGIHKVID